MTTQSLLAAADDPRMIAWNAYKATEEFENARRWATHPQHVEGSLWAAFIAGRSTEPTAPVETERAHLAKVLCELYNAGYFRKPEGEAINRALAALRSPVQSEPRAEPVSREVLIDTIADMANQFAVRAGVGHEGNDLLHDGGLSALAGAFEVLERLGAAYQPRTDRDWYIIDWKRLAAIVGSAPTDADQGTPQPSEPTPQQPVGWLEVMRLDLGFGQEGLTVQLVEPDVPRITSLSERRHPLYLKPVSPGEPAA